jgi:hypothetical protein
VVGFEFFYVTESVPYTLTPTRDLGALESSTNISSALFHCISPVGSEYSHPRDRSLYTIIRYVLINAHAKGLSEAPCPGPRN